MISAVVSALFWLSGVARQAGRPFSGVRERNILHASPRLKREPVRRSCLLHHLETSESDRRLAAVSLLFRLDRPTLLE